MRPPRRRRRRHLRRACRGSSAASRACADSTPSWSTTARPTARSSSSASASPRCASSSRRTSGSRRAGTAACAEVGGEHWLILNADAWLTDGSADRLRRLRRRASPRGDRRPAPAQSRRLAAALGPRLPDALAARHRVPLPAQARAAVAAAERVLRRRLRPRRAAPLRLGDGLVHARPARGGRRGRAARRVVLPLQRGDRLGTPVRERGLGGVVRSRRRVRPRRRRLARRAALPGERARPPTVPRQAPRRARTPSGRGGCCGSRLRARAAVFRGERGAQYREVAVWLGSAARARPARPMSGLLLLLRLAVGDRGRARARLGGRARARPTRRLGDARLGVWR